MCYTKKFVKLILQSEQAMSWYWINVCFLPKSSFRFLCQLLLMCRQTCNWKFKIYNILPVNISFLLNLKYEEDILKLCFALDTKLNIFPVPSEEFHCIWSGKNLQLLTHSFYRRDGESKNKYVYYNFYSSCQTIHWSWLANEWIFPA